jgi:1-phosphatidylinositol phosphodiesterase
MVYDTISSDIGKKYWVQTSGSVRPLLFYFACGVLIGKLEQGTLGQARGKLTLLQRFTFDLLPAYKTKQIGIQLDPSH